MPRYFLQLGYDGSAFHGWQVQNNASSVQSELDAALNSVLKERIHVIGAGRTDTGVHAIQMFCHFDVRNKIGDGEDLLYHVNAVLPKEISISKLIEVREDSHARFNAVSRTYLYRISLVKDPFSIGRAWYHPFAPDLKKMNEACRIIETTKHFKCFSKSGTQTKTDICTVSEAHWKKTGNNLEFEITADRFLRNMVRSIVGTMISIGEGKTKLGELKEIIASGDRRRAGFSAPAHGLYLKAIAYPNTVFKQ